MRGEKQKGVAMVGGGYVLGRSLPGLLFKLGKGWGR